MFKRIFSSKSGATVLTEVDGKYYNGIGNHEFTRNDSGGIEDKYGNEIAHVTWDGRVISRDGTSLGEINVYGQFTATDGTPLLESE